MGLSGLRVRNLSRRCVWDNTGYTLFGTKQLCKKPNIGEPDNSLTFTTPTIGHKWAPNNTYQYLYFFPGWKGHFEVVTNLLPT